jgi:hypothetical protein
MRIPITNVYGGGDYTAAISIGSQNVRANVILDTGSSTLAVDPSIYDVGADKSVQATVFAQDVIYGTGGWTGPVVTTKVQMGSGPGVVSIDAYLAITEDSEPGDFGQADGIMGLAYNALNGAYDLSSYLSQQGISPAVTYPWPFRVNNSSVGVQQFATFLSRLPQQDLPPYFTALESQGIARNIFAFYTLRSFPSSRTPTPLTDPLNSGFFVLGGGPEQTDLYTGEFINVDVVDDMYYNTNLLAVGVGSATPVKVKALPSQYAKTMVSNSIIDSGTNSLCLAPDVYNTVIAGLEKYNSSFGKLIQAANGLQPVASSDIQLADWPSLTFVLQGETGEAVTLSVSPSTYWQMDAGQAGEAIFQVMSSGMVQSILGLPLMNNYYTVFDRTQDSYGAVRFAPIALRPGT